MVYLLSKGLVRNLVLPMEDVETCNHAIDPLRLMQLDLSLDKYDSLFS